MKNGEIDDSQIHNKLLKFLYKNNKGLYRKISALDKLFFVRDGSSGDNNYQVIVPPIDDKWYEFIQKYKFATINGILYSVGNFDGFSPSRKYHCIFLTMIGEQVVFVTRKSYIIEIEQIKDKEPKFYNDGKTLFHGCKTVTKKLSF